MRWKKYRVEGSEDGNVNTLSPPQTSPQKESAIERLTREVTSAGFQLVTTKEYERLTIKKSWWVKFFIDESPRAIWTIIITGIITLCSFSFSWYKESKKSELEKLKADLKKEILAETQSNTQNPPN